MTKWELRSYRKIVRRIRQLKAEREELINIVKGIDGMPHGSGKSDPTADAGMRLADIAGEIEDEIAKLTEERSRITAVLSTLPEDERDLLHYHYILGHTWEQSAVRYDISYRWAMKLHAMALGRIRNL